jgi:hypothetical protein
MTEPKTITRSQYLQALALYTMASRLQQDVDRFNTEMNKLLGLDAPRFQDSRISDGIYSRPSEPFDLVLSYENIAVEPEAS